MKKHILYIMVAAVTLSLGSCNRFDGNAMQFDNAAYLDVAASKTSEAMTFNNLVTEQKRNFSVVLAYPSGEAVTAAIAVDPALAAEYNARYGTSWTALPAENYSVSANTVSIEAGKTVSDEVTIHFKDLDRLEIDKTYLCPLHISDCSMDLLEGSSKIFYLVKRSSAITTAASLRDNWINFPTLDKDSPTSHIFNGLEAVTYEALIYVDDFSRHAEISSIMGVEQYLLLRIGDASFPRRQLQFDGSGVGFGKFPKKDDAKLVSAGQWYHVAASYDRATAETCIYVDGKLQSRGTGMGTNNKPINLAMRALYDLYLKDPGNEQYKEYAGYSAAYQFFVGRSYNDERPLHGDVAEVRVWSVARTAEEIWEYMYDVDPLSPGLLGYWKFNEGSGNIIKDQTPNGNDGVAEYDLAWPSGIEIPQINKD